MGNQKEHNYLSDHIIDYFVENKDPVVKYLFAKEFPEYNIKFDRPDIFSLKKYSYLRKNIRNNQVHDIKKWHIPHKGAFYNLYIFIYLGYDIHDSFIENTLSFLEENYLTEEGSFSFNWKPKIGSLLWSGEFLFLCNEANYNTNKTNKLTDHIISQQNKDGSWSEKLILNSLSALKLAVNSKVTQSKEELSTPCIYTTISCLKGLISSLSSKDCSESIEKGLHFLLSQNIFFREEIKSENGFLQNKYFRHPGVPIWGQSDILTVLNIFSATKLKNHKFVTSAFNYLIKYETTNLMWRFKSKAEYMLENDLKSFNKKKEDPFLSLQMTKVLSRY